MTCDDAIVGAVDRTWRRRSTYAGGVGLYGPGRDFRDASRSAPQSQWGGDYVTKIPAIVARGRPARLAVPRAKRAVVRLSYGLRRRAFDVVRFVPCDDRRVTAYPGGLILADCDPITLKFRSERRRVGRRPVGQRG